MKKIYLIVAMVVSISLSTHAQDTLVVEQGQGTLNAAIEANGGNKIYKLKAGQWYGLNAPIENVDYHLQIIGAEPVDGGIPATLQTGSTAEGAVFENMLLNKGDITLENIYIMNVDLTGQTGARLIVSSKPEAKITVNKCVVDPVGITAGVFANGGDEEIRWTNNLSLREGHQLSPNDGHFFWIDPTQTGTGLDTLLVENNTFVCMGTTMFNSQFNAMTHDYVNWNHNTWVNQKSQFDWSLFEKEYYFTNNLIYNGQTQIWSSSWQPMPGADAGLPQPSLIYADTIPADTMVTAESPSTTVQFVYYNAHTRSEGFYTLLDELNTVTLADGLPYVYLMDFMYTEGDEADNSRESQMFNHENNTNASFPNWKYGNMIKDVDPEWVDGEIYTSALNFVAWTKPASLIHALGKPSENFPPASEWPQWHWEPDGDISINDTWPVFDGRYKSEELLQGAIEKNVPLGDLNWWPEAKAAWEAAKDDIEAHITSGNTDQIDIGYTTTAVEQVVTYKAFNMYPNPAQNELNFEFSGEVEISISSIDGRVLKSFKNVSKISTADLVNGLYLVTVKEGNIVSTQKLIIGR